MCFFIEYSLVSWELVICFTAPARKTVLVVWKLPVEPPRNKTNKMTVRPTKTQISLGIRPVWSESSLCAHWVGKDPRFLHADNEDSDQTGRMPRLIWVFAGRAVTLLVLSRGGSVVSVIDRLCKYASLLKWKLAPLNDLTPVSEALEGYFRFF